MFFLKELLSFLVSLLLKQVKDFIFWLAHTMEIRVLGSKYDMALISHWSIINKDWDRVNVTIQNQIIFRTEVIIT